jgi:hypothetical protein
LTAIYISAAKHNRKPRLNTCRDLGVDPVAQKERCLGGIAPMKRNKTRELQVGLKLNDTFEFDGEVYRISHLSEIGVRAEKFDDAGNSVPNSRLYWFGISQFESETGLKIDVEGGFPVPIQPHRYVVSPEGPGEITVVKGNHIRVRLFNLEGRVGRRKIATFTHDQLRSLSQWHPQLSNAGAYVKGIESIVIPFSKEVETKASVETVQDLEDGKWRFGITYQFPNTRGGRYGLSKFNGKMFNTRLDAFKAAVRLLKKLMREDLIRADTSPEQREKIRRAIEETDVWIRQAL